MGCHVRFYEGSFLHKLFEVSNYTKESLASTLGLCDVALEYVQLSSTLRYHGGFINLNYELLLVDWTCVIGAVQRKLQHAYLYQIPESVAMLKRLNRVNIENIN